MSLFPVTSPGPKIPGDEDMAPALAGFRDSGDLAHDLTTSWISFPTKPPDPRWKTFRSLTHHYSNVNQPINQQVSEKNKAGRTTACFIL